MRGAHSATRAVAQQIRPRFRRLAIALVQGYQLFAAIDLDPDQHQHARLGLVQADLQMHAVGPHVDEVGRRQVPLLERLVVLSPL
jgi:hypothetical protein